MMKRFTYWWLALLLVLGISVAPAHAQLGLPYTSFQPGQTISAAQFTTNFTAISNNALNRTGGTMTGTLTARDIAFSTHNAYDVGTSGTRARDGFFGRNVLVGGTFGVTGAATFGTASFTSVTLTGLTCTGCVDSTQLASTSVGASSYGSATSVATFVVDADGRLTSATSVGIQLPESQITDGAILARVASTETISGAWTFTAGTFTLSNALPILALNQTDGASNGKIWALVTEGTAFSLTAYNDGFAGGTNAIAINRSGSTITSIQLAASAITLSGPTTIGAITGTTAAFSGAVSGTTGTFSGAVSASSYGAVVGTTGAFSGIVQFGNGSAGSPIITGTNDNDTGLYFLTANQLGITAGGTARVLVNTSGLFPAAADTYLLGNASNYWQAVHATRFASGTGAANNAAYQVGAAGTGVYSPATGQLAFAAAGGSAADYIMLLDTDDGAGSSNRIYLAAEMASNTVYPSTDNTYRSGTSTNRWLEVYAVNGVIQTSDERTKTDIADVESALATLLQVRTIQFRWRAGPDTTRVRYGVSAQQLLAIGLDNLVYGNSRDGDDVLGVNYSEFTPLLIKSIQELEARVAMLEAQMP